MGKALFLAALLLINPALAQKKPVQDRQPRDIICATVIVIVGDGVASPQADQMLNDIRQSWRFMTGDTMSPEILARAMLACVDSPSSTMPEVFSTLRVPQKEPQETPQTVPQTMREIVSAQ